MTEDTFETYEVPLVQPLSPPSPPVPGVHHTHTTPPIILHTPLGLLKFRQKYTYDAPEVVPGPDPNTGHINYENGITVIIAPKPRDALQNVLEIRADIPAPTYAAGQEGRLVKDPAFPIKPIVESPTSSDSTAALWRKNDGISGNLGPW
jgi:hypothetical protein